MSTGFDLENLEQPFSYLPNCVVTNVEDRESKQGNKFKLVSIQYGSNNFNAMLDDSLEPPKSLSQIDIIFESPGFYVATKRFPMFIQSPRRILNYKYKKNNS